jgi:hypothetical protein
MPNSTNEGIGRLTGLMWKMTKFVGLRQSFVVVKSQMLKYMSLL